MVEQPTVDEQPVVDEVPTTQETEVIQDSPVIIEQTEEVSSEEAKPVEAEINEQPIVEEISEPAVETE